MVLDLRARLREVGSIPDFVKKSQGAAGKQLQEAYNESVEAMCELRRFHLATAWGPKFHVPLFAVVYCGLIRGHNLATPFAGNAGRHCLILDPLDLRASVDELQKAAWNWRVMFEQLQRVLAITACKEGRHWLRALQMLGSVEQTLAQSEFLLSSTLKACGARWQICLALVDSFDAFALPVVMTSLISA
eukprot:g22247.t1